MKILIIEDEKLLADSLKALLQRKGFEVEVVYDGETGAVVFCHQFLFSLCRIDGYFASLIFCGNFVYFFKYSCEIWYDFVKLKKCILKIPDKDGRKPA